jgi:type IV pilus assembly protein PilB
MISEATDWDDANAFAAPGCEHCSGRGTMGRIAVTEVLELTPKLRTHIAQHSSIEDLRKAALAEGITTLQQSAQRLIAEGLIPQEELRWTPSWNR